MDKVKNPRRVGEGEGCFSFQGGLTLPSTEKIACDTIFFIVTFLITYAPVKRVDYNCAKGNKSVSKKPKIKASGGFCMVLL